MLKSILNLKDTQALSKEAQRSINGGTINGAKCPIYSPQECQKCGGYPLPNGCCLGTRETHMCLTGVFE
ncbi:hypothetical protein [Aquimarina litoralis]|uniref:hypothetical protein n=1 Tax=Aquimarina litoralis TaxID=584605 RepID=UPI001C592760|nr:hypothetical protein [Aquimarina litoralis]MBW1295429.1 hypothetical protein [Aquimarina litoralis]